MLSGHPRQIVSGRYRGIADGVRWLSLVGVLLILVALFVLPWRMSGLDSVHPATMGLDGQVVMLCCAAVVGILLALAAPASRWACIGLLAVGVWSIAVTAIVSQEQVVQAIAGSPHEPGEYVSFVGSGLTAVAGLLGWFTLRTVTAANTKA